MCIIIYVITGYFSVVNSDCNNIITLIFLRSTIFCTLPYFSVQFTAKFTIALVFSYCMCLYTFHIKFPDCFQAEQTYEQLQINAHYTVYYLPVHGQEYYSFQQVGNYSISLPRNL